MTGPTSNQPLPRWLASLPHQLESILKSQAATQLHTAILRAQASRCPRRYMSKSAGQLKRNHPDIFSEYLAELLSSAELSPRHKAALHNIPMESFEQLHLLANGGKMSSALKQEAGRPRGNGLRHTPLEDAALLYLYHQASYESKKAKDELLMAIIAAFESGPGRHLLEPSRLRAKIQDWAATSFHGYDEGTTQIVLMHHRAGRLDLPSEARPEE